MRKASLYHLVIYGLDCSNGTNAITGKRSFVQDILYQGDMENKHVLQLWTKDEMRFDLQFKWARRTSDAEIHNHLMEVYGTSVMSK